MYREPSVCDNDGPLCVVCQRGEEEEGGGAASSFVSRSSREETIIALLLVRAREERKRGRIITDRRASLLRHSAPLF